MKDKLKYIAEPNLEYFPLHNFYIEMSSQSFTPKNKFDFKIINNYYLELLNLLKQKTVIFRESKWYVSKFDEDKFEKEFPPIFLDNSSKEMENFFINYNVENDINYGYSIPVTADYNQKSNNKNQYFFSLDHYFSDENSLKFYDTLIFKFHEEYNSRTKNFSSEALEIIMKCMVEVNDKYKFDFKIVSLADNAFIYRSSNGENDENYYEETYQVFPHRQVYAWKSIIKGNFTSKDIPEAAKVDNFMKGYTLVSTLSDDEYFSSYNPDHIYRANLIEIRLKELAVLPYSVII